MSAGGSDSSNMSASVARSNTFVDPLQQGVLSWLYGTGQGQANPGMTTAAAQGASNFSQPMLQQALQNTSALTDPTAQINAQTQSLQAGLGNLFREEINPAIQTGAIGAGALGGGRQGVAEGVATGQLANAFTQGYGDIVARANQTALGAASQLPSLSQALYQGAVNPTLAGMDPLTRLAQIIGGPTVLRQSGADSLGVGGSSGFNVGIDFG